MNLTEKEIGSRAEQALREAGGEWAKALEVFSGQVRQDQRLHDSLLDKAVAQELRKASARLGESTRKCPFCSEIVALDAAKCRFCGEWLADAPHSAPKAPPRPPMGGAIIRHFTLLTGWALIVLIVILIITFTR